MGYRPDWIERQLAHVEPSAVRRTCNHAEYLADRAVMMQRWAASVDVDWRVSATCCRSQRSAFGLSVGAPGVCVAGCSGEGRGAMVRERYQNCSVARLLYISVMRSATFPPIRVEPEVRAEVEAVLREGESLTQFIEEAVVAAAAWRRVQSEFITRGEAAIKRWKQEGGGHAVDEVMADLQARLDDAKRQAAQRVGR
jgi:hypothetical protein